MPAKPIQTAPTARGTFDVPAIVADWTAGRPRVTHVGGAEIAVQSGADATLASASIAGVLALGPGDFAERVTIAYQAIEAAVAATDHPHIVRWWNGIPGIHNRVDATRDRYMAFNAGRFAAMRRRFGDASLADEAPAASGVGIVGDTLVIHALAAALPGQSMQNARQRPAVRYSSRFGPLPPCFARATLAAIGETHTLLVSGTAAILGEDTVHLDDLSGQLRVTFEHLNKLVTDAGMVPADVESLRAYVLSADAADIYAAIAKAFPAAAVELIPAELCRRDLLVEIECIATRDDAQETGD